MVYEVNIQVDGNSVKVLEGSQTLFIIHLNKSELLPFVIFGAMAIAEDYLEANFLKNEDKEV